MTPKFELGRDFCTMHLPQVESFCVFPEVIVLTNKQTNKRTPLKTSNALRYATTLSNNFTVSPRINARGVYSYNRSEPPAFIWDPAFIKYCCIGLLHKKLCSGLLVIETNWFFPERDYVTFGSLLSQFRLSSVTLVLFTQGVEPFGNISPPLV